MAKACMVERDKKRSKKVVKYYLERKRLKDIIMNKEVSVAERFAAQLKLNSLPRDSSQSRKKNRCKVTGRPRGFYRKFKMSRIALRELAAFGVIPGVVKSSW